MKKLQISKEDGYKTDIKKYRHNKKVLEQLNIFVGAVLSGTVLPISFLDHELHGIYKGFRECHLCPDVLLIYKIEKDMLVIVAVRIGSHSDLF